MSYTIWKSFRFEGAHHLTGLPEGHQCGRQHGHSYRVTVELSDDGLIGPGFVADFGQLKPVKLWLDTVFDHHDLNEVLGPWWKRVGLDEDTAPTSENLAYLIYWVIKESHISGLSSEVTSSVSAVKISETETSLAEYRP